jgi:hypothetical protein
MFDSDRRGFEYLRPRDTSAEQYTAGFRLGLEVTAVSDGTARFRIFETNPLKPRFEVCDPASLFAESTIAAHDPTHSFAAPGP